jgi:hypothetical protein
MLAALPLSSMSGVSLVNSFHSIVGPITLTNISNLKAPQLEIRFAKLCIMAASDTHSAYLPFIKRQLGLPDVLASADRPVGFDYCSGVPAALPT